MATWLWIVIAVAVLICAVVLGPIVLYTFRMVWGIANATSPKSLLQLTNFWTEIQHIKNGGSTQMMKMKDGNFILLSVGADTTKVFAASNLESAESFIELASFPIFRSGENKNKEGETILNKLRPAIGWPNSVGDLRATLATLTGKNFSLMP